MAEEGRIDDRERWKLYPVLSALPVRYTLLSFGFIVKGVAGERERFGESRRC